MEFVGAARMFLTFGFYKAGHDGVILAYGGEERGVMGIEEISGPDRPLIILLHVLSLTKDDLTLLLTDLTTRDDENI